MMRSFQWCAALAMTGAMIAGIGSRWPSAAAQTTCLHEAAESTEQAARRKQALAFTRHVNTMQARSKPHASLPTLQLSQPVPGGFAAKLSADGTSYSFSVIDQTDPCRFGYFSDDNGMIYQGQALR